MKKKLSPAQRIARSLNEVSGDALVTETLTKVAGPPRKRVVKEEPPSPHRTAAVSKDPLVLRALFLEHKGTADSQLLGSLLMNEALPYDVLEEIALSAASSMDEQLLYRAFLLLSFDGALAVLKAAKSSPCTSLLALSALFQHIPPSDVLASLKKVCSVSDRDTFSAALCRWGVSGSPAESSTNALLLARSYPEEALVILVDALEHGINLDLSTAQLLLRLVKRLPEEFVYDTMESLEWALEGGSSQTTVSLEAADLLVRSDVSMLHVLALRAPLLEKQLLVLARTGPVESLVSLAGFQGLTLPVVEAALQRFPALPDWEEAAEAFLERALPVLAAPFTALLPLALKCGAADPEYLHPSLIALLVGGWECLPTPSELQLVPRPVLSRTALLLLRDQYAFDGEAPRQIDLESSPLLLALWEEAPGVVAAWAALPNSEWKEKVGSYLRLRLDQLLGPSPEVWEIFLNLAPEFEGGLLELALAARALAATAPPLP